MKKEILTRKELYELVWQVPRTKLLEKYAISNDGFIKLCKKMVIPIPKGGHWQKLKHNKTIKVEELPDNFKGEDRIELIIREVGDPVNFDQTPLTILTKQIQNDVNAPLKVPDNLVNPDQLIVYTKEYWELYKKHGWRSDYKKDVLSISVEEKNKNRALRIMNSLIKLLKYRGHSITKNYNGTVAVVDNVEIELYLREATKRIPAENNYSSSKYIPTGELVLKTGRYSSIKEWRDGKVPLEDQLAKIIAKMEIDAQIENKWKEEARIKKILQDERDRIRKEFEKLRDDDLNKFKELIENSKRYQKVEMIRKYINTVKNYSKENNTFDNKIQDWVEWANKKADWFDPLINAEDKLLDDIDKDTLLPIRKSWY